MTAVTNLTNLTNAGNFIELVDYANDTTEGVLIIMFVLSLFIIITTLLLRRYEYQEAVFASSFVCLMLSIVLTSINLLPFQFLIGFATVWAFMALYIYLIKR